MFTDIGDMRKADPSVLPASQRDYFQLATRMEIGDKVLIEAHHYPFAFATVASGYFYITARQEELNVWFRHFRRVKDVRFVGDIVTNPKKWPQITMTDTISSLKPGGVLPNLPYTGVWRGHARNRDKIALIFGRSSAPPMRYHVNSGGARDS